MKFCVVVLAPPTVTVARCELYPVAPAATVRVVAGRPETEYWPAAFAVVVPFTGPLGPLPV